MPPILSAMHGAATPCPVLETQAMKKYLVISGPVRSQYDGEIHHIAAGRLIELYRVKPAECVVYQHEAVYSAHDLASFEKLDVLAPSPSGDYRLPMVRQRSRLLNLIASRAA